MPEKIIDKINLVKSLGDLKKFIEYKKNVKEKISFDEFYELYKIMDKNISCIDFINTIDFSIENNWLDYLPRLDYKENTLDKNMIDKIFSHYSKDTLSLDTLDWIFRAAKNGAISKNLVTKIFSSRIDNSLGHNNKRATNEYDNDLYDILIKKIMRGKYDFCDLYRLIVKCEDNAISYKIAYRIIAETNFAERYMRGSLKISKTLYTQMLSVFDSEAQKLIENKFKLYIYVFEFNFETIIKPETWSEFGQLFRTQFKDSFMEYENWLKVFSLAPDFGNYLSCTCPCPYIIYKKYIGSTSRFYIDEFTADHHALIEEKLSIAKLKKRVLCGAGIDVCGLLLNFIPDEIDHVFLYWISFLYERTTVMSWGSHVLTSETGYKDGEHITANRRTANFYAKRFSGTMNQYSLCRFIKIFKDGSITEPSAKKFLEDLRFIEGEQIEFGDQNYNKILSKFTDAGRKVFEKYFLVAKSLYSKNNIS